MNDNSFRKELIDKVREGADSQKLLETQQNIFSKMKTYLAKELANTRLKKTLTPEGFIYEGLEALEKLQAELSVISKYEDAIKVAISNGHMASANLNSLDERL